MRGAFIWTPLTDMVNTAPLEGSNFPQHNIWSPTPVTSPVVVIGREQSTNLSRHSVILQQKTLTGGCGKRGCRWGLGKTEREVGERKKVEWIGGVQQVEFRFCVVLMVSDRSR